MYLILYSNTLSLYNMKTMLFTYNLLVFYALYLALFYIISTGSITKTQLS
jgi:hypothetical protein